MTVPSNIYQFSDYREFLKDRYRQLKEADPIFSFRNFSKAAGFGSPNYLKLVMDGKRNLSAEAIGKFAKGLRLDAHESEYFRYTVEYNQCESEPKKRVYEAKLLYLRELFKVKTLIPELYDYYHEWYHAAIREVIRNGECKNNPSDLGQHLVPTVGEEQVAASIALLKKLNFITEGTDGILNSVDNVEVDSSQASLAQKVYYEQMAELAAQSLYTQGPETQDFEAITLSIPPERVCELRSEIHSWLERLGAKSSHTPGDSVYQLNVQLFAMSRVNTPALQDSQRNAGGTPTVTVTKTEEERVA